MVRNGLLDLNNHLFEQIERVNDESLTDEELAREIKRSKSLSEIAQTIINNANTMMKASIVYGTEDKVPKLLDGIDDEKV